MKINGYPKKNMYQRNLTKLIIRRNKYCNNEYFMKTVVLKHSFANALSSRGENK